MNPLFYLVVIAGALLVRKTRKSAVGAPPAPSPGGSDPELARLQRQNDRLKRQLARKASTPAGEPPAPPAGE